MRLSATQSPLIDRGQELEDLKSLVASGRSALALVIGRPKIGKTRLLDELAERAGAMGCRVFPSADGDADTSTPLSVGRETTVAAFSAAVAADSHDPQFVARTADESPVQLILIRGYQPSPAFAGWFSDEFIAGLAADARARIVVVEGYESDVAALEPQATLKVALGPLPKSAVSDFLAGLMPRGELALTPQERDAYAALGSEEPEHLTPLVKLLQLDTASLPDDAASFSDVSRA